MAEKEIKLKPCPFCGNTDVKTALINSEYKGTEEEEELCFWIVGCLKCQALGKSGKTEAEAAKNWNQGVELKEKEDATPRYIDANSLKKELVRAGAICDFGLYKIDIQPTADVQEVKHGKWAIIHSREYLVCSNCTLACAFNGYVYKYCPHCGAKMDGE